MPSILWFHLAVLWDFGLLLLVIIVIIIIIVVVVVVIIIIFIVIIVTESLILILNITGAVKIIIVLATEKLDCKS